MNELLDTERAYVEELLCVLEVRLLGSRVCTACSSPQSTVLKGCIQMSVCDPQRHLDFANWGRLSCCSQARV